MKRFRVRARARTSIACNKFYLTRLTKQASLSGRKKTRHTEETGYFVCGRRERRAPAIALDEEHSCFVEGTPGSGPRVVPDLPGGPIERDGRSWVVKHRHTRQMTQWES